MNQSRRSQLARLGALASASLLFPLIGQAQDAYPGKPIKLVVPFGPGGSADMLARVIAEGLGAALKTTVVVENRPGATGTIGAAHAARSAPDGYTLLLAFDGTVAIAPAIQSNFPFDPQKDLAPVSKLADVDLVIVVNPSVPARNIRELIEYGKANPGKLSYASPGMGSTAQMAGELLRVKAGLDWVHVPYASGSGKFVMDVVGGSVPAAFISVAVAAPFVADKKLVGIGVPSAQRNRAIPDVPTFRESGLPGFDAASWFGLSAPAGTPKDVVDRLNKEVHAVLSNPATAKRLQDAGLTPSMTSPAEFGSLIRSDLAKWGEVARQASIKN
jgi:tripartite-type tricarboxylate transporter receptor subunit TctC